MTRSHTSHLNSLSLPGEVQASAYRCGVGEPEPASWDDLPRIMLQMEENPNFLSERCVHVEDVVFSFDWSQRELFELKMEM